MEKSDVKNIVFTCVKFKNYEAIRDAKKKVMTEEDMIAMKEGIATLVKILK